MEKIINWISNRPHPRETIASSAGGDRKSEMAEMDVNERRWTKDRPRTGARACLSHVPGGQTARDSPARGIGCQGGTRIPAMFRISRRFHRCFTALLVATRNRRVLGVNRGPVSTPSRHFPRPKIPDKVSADCFGRMPV